MTSDNNPGFIPDPIQAALRDLAERAQQFADTVERGGSWVEVYTWLLAMEPGLLTMLDIGLDGIPKSSRLTIHPEQQDKVLRDFAVPDTPPQEEP